MILLHGSTAWTLVKLGRRILIMCCPKKKRKNTKDSKIDKNFPHFLQMIASSIMSRPQRQILLYLFITFFPNLPFPSFADVGTAAHYSPPYLPTGCYGGEALQFPSSNLFAAAGDGIWDNGAACGRQYLVRCISAEQPRTCIPEQSIQIKIVDYAVSTVSTPSATGTTMVLSQKAFQTIANSSAALINIEFQQV